ncbi:hypothetical protein [Polaribacter sp. Q13]|uniref:hypothetical protein n=1 Tax=Polaribacter sp. Q13 TaxID=2806551 RepID=UPI002078E5CC|nr:hypothetical protein [Polaribacter sp. Q13]
MVKRLLPLFILFITFTSLSQETKILLSGKVTDSLGAVQNANIINLEKKQGTFSFDDGHFKIYASEGDSLQISTIQYTTRKIIISKEIIDSKTLTIKLKRHTYVLDAFDLKRNNLTGSISIDLKEVPTDRRDSLLQNTLDFSKIDFKIVDTRIDENLRMKPPIVNTVANSFSGGGGSTSIPFKFKDLILKRELNRKKGVPNKILSELGEQFFFEELKIPKKITIIFQNTAIL